MLFKTNKYPNLRINYKDKKTIQFKDGQVFVEDKELQKRLSKRDDVEGEAPVENEKKPVNKMSKDELIQYAEENDIEIDASANKDVIKKTVEEAEEQEKSEE